jgi:hypothetical protein
MLAKVTIKNGSCLLVSLFYAIFARCIFGCTLYNNVGRHYHIIKNATKIPFTFFAKTGKEINKK